MSIEAVDVLSASGLVEADIVELHGVPLLDLVQITGTREGGLIDGWVPAELIDHEEVPVKEEHARSLARQMREVAERDGGTGQYEPIILGLIEGEDTLKIIDGFHRDAALELNDEGLRYATIKLTDWNSLYDFRIFTAKDHAHVRFSRVVQWIGEVWQYSGLADKLSVEQAVLLYRFETDGSKLGLDPNDVAAAKAWVEKKEEQWDMAAMTIHSHLKIAENVDPRLVHSTREKRSGHVLEAPTQVILKTFSTQIPNNFELQNMVMDLAKQHNLQGPEVKALCISLRECDGLDAAEEFANNIDWPSWQPVYSEDQSRAMRQAHDPRHKGAAVFNKVAFALGSINQRLDRVFANQEEVTDEMKVKLAEARKGAEDLASNMGSLILKLSELIGDRAYSNPSSSSASRSAVGSDATARSRRPPSIPTQPSALQRRTSTRTRRSSEERLQDEEDVIDFKQTVRDFLDSGGGLPIVLTLKEVGVARSMIMHIHNEGGASASVLRNCTDLNSELNRVKSTFA